MFAFFFLFLLLVLCLIVGVVIAVVWFFVSPRNKRPKVATVVALPFGCVAIPIVGLLLLAAIGALLHKSDKELAEELFGRPTTLIDQRMLFDDFGGGRSREIYMRAEMTDAERASLLPADAVESDLTLADFQARGDAKGFTWWISTDPEAWHYCASARIRDAPGFNGWSEFRYADCLDAGTEFPQSANKGMIYVIASRGGD